MNIGEIDFNDQDYFFDNFQKVSLIKIKQNLKSYFENIDQEIFLSSWRKSNGYIPDGFKSRTILTIYGRVTYKRRIYKYWNKIKYQYVFLADKKLQIEKYSRVTSHLKFKILEQIATGKRQQDICDMFSFANLTRATIGNIIKSFDFQNTLKCLSDNIIKIKIPEYLYINMDETYIKLRKNNKMYKYRIRLVTFHTGYHQHYSTNKRKVLANKRVYCQILPIAKRINTIDFIILLEKIAKKFYSNVNEAKVIIGGDGASWIRKVTKYWPNSEYILDKFHSIRYLKQIFPNKNSNFDLQGYQDSKKLFELGSYHELIMQLKQITTKPGKKEKFAKIINYFINNAIGISNQKLAWNIGVSAEGDVSHIVKWLLGYGSKAFNYQTFKNMLLLKIAKTNQLNIIDFLRNQYQLAKEEIKNFYWKSHWLAEENSRYLI